jgi:hypothetical protein
MEFGFRQSFLTARVAIIHVVRTWLICSRLMTVLARFFAVVGALKAAGARVA